MGLFRESHSLALEGGNRLYAAIAMENLAALTHTPAMGTGAAIVTARRCSSIARSATSRGFVPAWAAWPP